MVSIIGPEIEIEREFRGESPTQVNQFLKAFRSVQGQGAKIRITKTV